MAELLSDESFVRVDRPRAQSEGPATSPRLPSTWVRHAPQVSPAQPSFLHDLATSTHSNDVGAEAGTGSLAVGMKSQAPDPDLLPSSASSLPMHTSSITSRDWTLSKLMKDSSNFQEVRRVSCLDKAWTSTAEDCEREGIPLIVEDWHAHNTWNEAFKADFLLAKHADDVVSTRNVGNFKDADMKFSDFIEYSRTRTPPHSTRDALLYAKDVECPEEWREWFLSGALPSELQPHGCTDLLRHLPKSEQVETTLCYYGIGGTFTPCHKDLCGSTGHNLMCHAENGSSFWFMTASNAASEVAKYFQDIIGGELDWENRAITVEELRNAPFAVYVAEQKLGDLIIIPPRSCHQVVNHGGLTMKLSWSRMTMKGLTMALFYELPVYRRVCRPEIYRVKSVLHYSLRHYTNELEDALQNSREVAKKKSREIALLEMLVSLFERVLREEFGQSEHVTYEADCTPAPSLTNDDSPSQTPSHTAGGRDQYACDYCGADIFQSYFKCETCCPAPASDDPRAGDALVICAACYVEGRSCKCGIMTPTQRHRMEALLDDRNKAALILHHICTPEMAQGHELSMNDLKESDDVCVFQAACVLHARRDFERQTASQKLPVRTCRWARESPHGVPNWSGVYCITCHSSHCMMHLLKMGVHASQAFLAQEKTAWKTDTSSQWHEFHQRAKPAVEHVMRAWTSGESIMAPQAAKLGPRLALAAQGFRNSRTLNPRFTVAGFYDYEIPVIEPIESTTAKEDEDINVDMKSTTLASRSQTSLLDAPCPSPPAFESPMSSLSDLSDLDSPRRSVSVNATDTFGESPSRSASMAPLPDSPGVVCLDDPPPLPRRNRAYVLAPAPSQKKRPVPDASNPPPKRRKKVPPGLRFPDIPAPVSGSRSTARVIRQPKPSRVRARAYPLESPDEGLREDYAPSLANVMQQAWHPPRKEGPSGHIRREESSESDPDPPALQAARKASRVSEIRSVSRMLPFTSSQHDSDHENIRSWAAKTVPRLSGPDTTPSVVATSSQQRGPVTMRPPEPRSATGPALVRLPRSYPPGKPTTASRDALPEQTSPVHRPRVAQSKALARDTLRMLNASEAQPIPDLEERLRQFERDKIAADRRLEDTESKLAAARAESETLRQENYMLQDFRRMAEERKTRIGELEGGIQKLEQCFGRMNGTLERKDQEINAQELQLATQREELTRLNGEFEKQQVELNEYKWALSWLGDEFECYLREGSNMQPAVTYQQNMTQGAAFRQLQQHMDKLMNIWSTQRLTGGAVDERSRLPTGNNSRSFTSGPGPSVGASVVTTQWACFGPEDHQVRSQPQGSSRHPTYSPPRGGYNGRRGSPRRYANYGRQNCRDRGPLPPPIPQHQGQPYSPTSRSTVQRWVEETGSRSRSPDSGIARTESSHERPRNLMDRIQGVDYGSVAPHSPPPAPSQLEHPRHTPSSTYRGHPESRRDESRSGSPRAPSLSTQLPYSSRSEYWEDSYGREERDDGSRYGSRTTVSGRRSPATYSVNNTVRHASPRRDTTERTRTQGWSSMP